MRHQRLSKKNMDTLSQYKIDKTYNVLLLKIIMGLILQYAQKIEVYTLILYKNYYKSLLYNQKCR